MEDFYKVGEGSVERIVEMRDIAIILLLSSCSSVKIQNVEVRQKTNVSPKDKLITICAYTSGYSLANHFYYRKP